MDIVNNINTLIAERGMNKKDFAEVLQRLNPRLKRTGDIPNIQTIYGYLNGKREIKIELIPYIADALGVSIQKLFSPTMHTTDADDTYIAEQTAQIITLLNDAPHSLREEIHHMLLSLQKETREKLRTIRNNTIRGSTENYFVAAQP